MNWLLPILLSVLLASPWFGIWLLARGMSQAFGMIEDLYKREQERLAPGESPTIAGRKPQVERLPDDFGIAKLRGCWFVFADDANGRTYLQGDGTWNRECEKVFTSRPEAEAFIRVVSE